MRMKPLVMLTMLGLSAGCAEPLEGRATALLDAASPYVVPHGKALAGGDMAAARESGARLLAVLCEWRQTCERPGG